MNIYFFCSFSNNAKTCQNFSSKSLMYKNQILKIKKIRNSKNYEFKYESVKKERKKTNLLMMTRFLQIFSIGEKSLGKPLTLNHCCVLYKFKKKIINYDKMQYINMYIAIILQICTIVIIS